MAFGQRIRGRKGKGDKNSWGSATTNSDVGNKKRGLGRVVTNLMRNINLP
jgi:hypothetical protein